MLSVDSLESALDQIRPERFFAVLALSAGLFLVFAYAPFEAPDEASHFWRAYHVSEGNVLSSRQGDFVGGYIPKSVAEAHLPFENLVVHPDNKVNRIALSEKLHEPFSTGDRVFVVFGFPSLYTPFVYIPQTLGIAVGRLFDLSALKIMYAGRITNLLCWIAVVTVAIRMMPVCKWVLALVALLPMSLSQSASLSADGPTNAMAMLLISWILRITIDKESRFNKHQAIAVILLCVLVSVSKQAYAPLTGLVLLIPVARFKDRRCKRIFCATAIVLACAATGLWSMMIRDLYMPIHGDNAPEQLSLVMAAPWNFVKIVIDTIEECWRGYVTSFIGILGFLDTSLPNWIYYSYPFVLIGTALFDRGCGEPMDGKQRLWMVAICIGVFLLIELSMYLTWTKPGEEIIDGVQGRYFLPIAVPVLLALFYNRKFKSPAGALGPLIIATYPIVVLVATCLRLYERYWHI